MEKLFDISVINTLKDGIKKGWWTLEDLDKPPPGWIECINNSKGNKAFPKSITSLPVTYGTADLLKVTVSFNYDRYVMTRS